MNTKRPKGVAADEVIQFQDERVPGRTVGYPFDGIDGQTGKRAILANRENKG